MTFKSIIEPGTDIETLFDSKNRIVAVYEKGKCKRVTWSLSPPFVLKEARSGFARGSPLIESK